MDTENAQRDESHDVQISAIQQVKRGRGRPRGSLNRITRSTLQKQAASRVNPASDDTSKECDGTSDGGHVMGAEGSFAMPRTLEAEKRRPGRPPKATAGFSVSVEVVDGPAAVSPAVHPKRPLAPIFTPRPIPIVSYPAEASMPSLVCSASESNPEPTIPHVQVPAPLLPDSFIIPRSNPTQPISSVESEDDSLYTGLDGDGVNEDEHDFTSDPNDIEDDGAAVPSGRRGPPPYVMEAFKHQLAFVKSHIRGTGNQAKNRVYDKMQSFWMPHKDTFFLLQSLNITPTLLFNPCFLYWDPLLLVDQIACPNAKQCGGKLWRHDYSDHPRACLDLEEWVWLFCARYRCNNCKNPSAIFQAWDPRIMAHLPKQLATQFPAILSHRRAISVSLFAMMRQCFFNGMGAKQFSDTINVLHRQKYAGLHIQYLQTLHTRSSGRTYPPFLPFEDQSPQGLHGVIPSARWFRDMYDNFIESHPPSFDQHMALLSARGCAIDHSFKIAKQIAKVQGQKVFEALLSITNEYGQIRICDLVPTKAHSQFDIALSRMFDFTKHIWASTPRGFLHGHYVGQKHA